MKRLVSFCKELRLGQFLSLFLAGVVLFISTACSSGNTQGANPDNPGVQAGGMNNPQKRGGDNYVNSKMSSDPKVSPSNRSDRADLQLTSGTLLANASSDSKLLYPSGTTTTTGTQSILSSSQEKSLRGQAERTSKQSQPTLIQRDPDANLLEKIGEEFRDASGFLKAKSDEAGARPEAQSNPALHK